jgi:hypothetical protein
MRYESEDGLPRFGGVATEGALSWFRKKQRRDLFHDVTGFESYDWRSHAFADDDLEHLKAFPKLRFLRINADGVTDHGVRQLAELRTLVVCVLFDSQITDEGLADLASLPNLRALVLHRAKITDAGLNELASSPRLLCLDLGQTSVTDAGLESLVAFPKLEMLSLTSTEVSDEGAELLCQMDRLRTLNLNNTLVTPAGAARIQHALPHCRVSHPSLPRSDAADGWCPMRPTVGERVEFAHPRQRQTGVEVNVIRRTTT